MDNYLKKFNINDDLITLCTKCEKELQEQFSYIENISSINHAKVLEAFQEYNVSEPFFNTSTGYGYDDFGRDHIEKIYAKILDAEDALVRTQFVSRNSCFVYCPILFTKTTEIQFLA